jgi:hypothetical protein
VQPVQEPEIVQRVKRYAGQTMRTARNPNITARECIELANWIVATPPAAHDLQAELDATNRQVEILSDALAESQREVAALKAVQEPVVFYRCNGCGHAYEQVHPTSCDCMEAGGFERVEYYTTPPAAQPAVPDAIGPNEDELPAYAAGWNDCRQAMLEMMK